MSDYWEENGIEKPQQVVVAAACCYKKIILVGARHWDKVMRFQYDCMQSCFKVPHSQFEEGFIDQFGEFLTREQALAIVKANGQRFDAERNGSTVELYSEGLY